jgi:hypothetical protein
MVKEFRKKGEYCVGEVLGEGGCAVYALGDVWGVCGEGVGRCPVYKGLSGRLGRFIGDGG